MILKFKSKIDQGVDREMRQAFEDSRYKNQKIQSVIYIDFLLIVPFILFALLDRPYLILVGIITVLFFSWFYWKNYDERVRKNIYKHFLKERETKEPLDAEYEITDEKLIFRMLGDELHCGWKNLTSYKENLSDIEIDFKGSKALFHDEIFSTLEEKEKWKKALTEKWNKHKTLTKFCTLLNSPFQKAH